MDESDKKFVTHDVQLAAYLRLKGHDCTKVTVDHRGRGIMEFDLSQDDANDVGLQYCNSEHATFEGIRRGFLKQIDNLKRQASNKGR